LTGERPFQGEQLSTIVHKIVTEEPEEAQRINGTLTPQIDAVLRRGLAKKPRIAIPTAQVLWGRWRWRARSHAAGKPAPRGAGPDAEVMEAGIRPVAAASVKPAEQGPPEMPVRRRSAILPLFAFVVVLLSIAERSRGRLAAFPV